MNYDNLTRLGWTATQTVEGMNGYYDWEKMNDTQKQILDLHWRAMPDGDKAYLRAVVIAAIDAYCSAVLV